VSGASALYAAVCKHLGSRQFSQPASESTGTKTDTSQGSAGAAVGSSGCASMSALASMEQCLACVMSLARKLAVDGPWWEEARAKHALLTIDCLHRTLKVSPLRDTGVAHTACSR
jgi:hypothetical protein